LEFDKFVYRPYLSAIAKIIEKDISRIKRGGGPYFAHQNEQVKIRGEELAF
jgi:hypothetical protein